MVQALKSYCTVVRPYTHLAVKLTGLGDMDMFKEWSVSQNYLKEKVFRANQKNQILTRSDLESFLKN